MGDDNQTQQDDNQQQSAGDLRTQLEAEREKNRKLTAENTGYKQADQLRELGYGHLNARQKRTLIRDLADEGKDLDAESVGAIVSDYGWPTEAPKQQQQENQDGQDNGQQQQQQQQDDGGEFDDGVNDSLSAIGLMQRAARLSGGTEVKSDFEAEMKATNSKEELRDLIRTKGPRHGIVHEWDVP